MPISDFDNLLNKALQGNEKAVLTWYGYTQSASFSPEEITQALEKINSKIESESENGNALYLKGIWHQFGIGGLDSKNNEAVVLFEQAQTLNNPFAMNDLAAICYANNNFEQAITLLEKAIECGGGARVRTNLANLYSKKAKNIDLDKAIKLLDEAIEANDPVAMYDRAWMYLQGIGGPKDRRYAEQLFDKAIVLGHHEAMKSQAKIYLEQEDANYIDAYRLMEKYATATGKNVDAELKNIFDQFITHTKSLLKGLDAKLFNNLCSQIEKIRTYGEEIGFEKGTGLKELAKSLTNKIDAFIFDVCASGCRITPDSVPRFFAHELSLKMDKYKKAFKRQLKEKDDLIETHREAWKPIVVNILIALSGIGLVLIIASVLAEACRSHANKTKFSVNHAFFFAQTKSQKLAEEVLQANEQWVDKMTDGGGALGL